MLAFFRCTFSEIRQFWSNEGPAEDCFWWLDFILLLGGIKRTFTSQWKRGYLIRYFSNFVFAYQGFVFTLQVNHSLHHEQDDMAILVFELLKLFIFSVAGSKMIMHSLLLEPILVVKNFIISNSVHSGDKDNDEFEQRKFNLYARTTMRLSISLMFVNVVAFSIPNSITERALGLPPQLQGFGPHITNILHCFAVSFMPFGIIPRFFTNFNTVLALLLGMRAKLRMLTHRYRQLLVQPIFGEDCDWEIISREIRTVLDQQLEYWRFLNILKDLVGKIFFVIHYSSICTIGAFLFIAQHTGINIFAASLASGATFFLLEYYILCSLVDTLQDEGDAIGDVIYELCAKLPYRRESHSEYVQMQSSLMIIWTNTKYGLSMNCFGVFEISTLAFVELANTAYMVLTFLISIG
ncbi:AAEL017105-PA [Aedes aegypti]|uniref:Odorant receptor 106 n=2 Tax=Aedes aegypti TaxID=7159 RepID=J9EAC2_AEDAE|nr:AAEL017105-PA [Aedes aegypti]DAA80436.1 TPA_exp: odorant receptor 106 [Aedes aegypti]